MAELAESADLSCENENRSAEGETLFPREVTEFATGADLNRNFAKRAVKIWVFYHNGGRNE